MCERETDRQTDRQTERETDRGREKHRERHRDAHTHIHTHTRKQMNRKKGRLLSKGSVMWPASESLRSTKSTHKAAVISDCTNKAGEERQVKPNATAAALSHERQSNQNSQYRPSPPLNFAIMAICAAAAAAAASTESTGRGTHLVRLLKGEHRGNERIDATVCAEILANVAGLTHVCQFAQRNGLHAAVACAGQAIKQVVEVIFVLQRKRRAGRGRERGVSCLMQEYYFFFWGGGECVTLWLHLRASHQHMFACTHAIVGELVPASSFPPSEMH